MKKKRTSQKLTAEDLARRAETRRMAAELADYHEALSKKLGEPERRRAVLGR